MKKKKEYPLLLIKWVDTCSHAGWFTPEEAKTLCSTAEVFTVGYLVQEDKKEITLAQGISEDEGFLNWTCIPKKWILVRKKIRA